MLRLWTFVAIFFSSLLVFSQNQSKNVFDVQKEQMRLPLSTIERMNSLNMTAFSCLKEPSIKAFMCPRYLSTVVDDSKEDRSAGLVMSRLQECYDLHDSDKKTLRNYADIHGPQQIQREFENSNFKNLGEYTHSVAQQCARTKNIKPEVISRFYYMSSRLNAAASVAAQEQVRINKILKKEKETHCPNQYLLTAGHKACEEEIKCSNNVNVASLANQAEKDLVIFEKTKRRLSQLSSSCDEKPECKTEKDALTQIMQALLIKNPWFLDSTYLGQGNFSAYARMESYLKRTQEQLTKYQSDLEKASLCIHSDQDKGCDIFDLRELIEKTPTLPVKTASVIANDKLAKHMGFQACVDDVTLQRDRTAQMVNAPVLVSLELLVTWRVGGLVSTGRTAKMVLPRLAALLGAETATYLTFNSDSWDNIKKTCIEKRTQLKSSTMVSEVPACQKQDSPLSERVFEDGNCLVDAALGAFSVLPMAGTTYQIIEQAKKVGYLKSGVASSQAASEAIARSSNNLYGYSLTAQPSTLGSQTSTLSDATRLQISAETKGVAATSSRFSGAERRGSSLQPTSGNIYLTRSGVDSYRYVKVDSIPQLPKGIEIVEVRKVDGRTSYMFSAPDKLPNGTWVKTSKEFLIDPITGGIDATSPAGKELFERMASSMSGKAHFAFFDVGSLGFVNKNFKAGDVAGDRYLKGVAEKVLKNGEGKVTLARTGGDEFGLIINETDPKEVKRILEKIRDSIKSDMKGDAKKVFWEEKAERASEFKASLFQFKKDHPDISADELQKLLKMTPDELRAMAGQSTSPSEQKALESLSAIKQPIHDISRTSVPDVSIGSTQIGFADDFSSLATRAEETAKGGKIESALQQGRPALKYGDDRSPATRPNPLFKSSLSEPTASSSWIASASDATTQQNSLAGLRSMNYTRTREVARVGDSTVAEYKDELGQVMYRSERYVTHPQTFQKVAVLTDIPTKGSSGLLDGTHPESQYLILNHFAKSQDTVLVMPKLRSLKYLNYFENGTQAGDEVISVVSELLKAQTRKASDLTFKMNGADFLWSAQGLPTKTLQGRFDDISKQLKDHPRIKQLLDKEKTRLVRVISESEKAGKKVDAEKYREQLHRVQNFDFDLQFDTLTRSEVKPTATVQEIQKQFDDKFKARYP